MCVTRKLQVIPSIKANSGFQTLFNLQIDQLRTFTFLSGKQAHWQEGLFALPSVSQHRKLSALHFSGSISFVRINFPGTVVF